MEDTGLQTSQMEQVGNSISDGPRLAEILRDKLLLFLLTPDGEGFIETPVGWDMSKDVNTISLAVQRELLSQAKAKQWSPKDAVRVSVRHPYHFLNCKFTFEVDPHAKNAVTLGWPACGDILRTWCRVTEDNYRCIRFSVRRI